MNIKDVKSKTVPLILMDGKERHLRFTLNALAELEDKYGSVEAAFNKVEKENSVSALRYVLWAGLMWEDDELTEKQVGNLIDLNYMQEMITTLGVALDGDMPVDPQAKALAAQSVPLADKVNSDGNPN
jgi:hypothetical protein